MTNSENPRILIVRLSAIGDAVHGLPVACALREAFPKAFLGWVVEGRSGDVVEGHRAIDQVIRVPRRWLKSLREIRNLRRQLRALQFDVTVDIQSLTKSAVAAWLSGAPRRIGAAGVDGRELSKLLNNELVAIEADHVVEHYLGFLKPLGIERPQVQFDLPIGPTEADFARQVLAKTGYRQNGFTVINPGAGWPSKLWPTERYGTNFKSRRLSTNVEKRPASKALIFEVN